MHRALAILLPALILAAFTSGALAAGPTKWRISHFDVVQAEPWEGGSREGPVMRIAQMFGFDTMDEVEVTHPLTPATKAEMEAFLHAAAGLLQQWGFPQPSLTDIVERADGKTAYRIYYTNLPEASGLYDHVHPDHTLVPNLPAIFVNADDVMDEDGVRPFGYDVLAHELFHAVQYSTPFYQRLQTFFGHRPNPWLTEGQAAAVSWDIVRILKPDKFSAYLNPFRAWGSRDYSEGLVVEGTRADPNPTEAYRTASFWRYLAEVNYAKENPRRYASYPGPEPFPVDYGYLADFIQRTPMQLDDGNDELDWLDAVIRGYPGFRAPLRDYFAEFLAAYADYGAHRVRRTHRPEAIRWLERGFSRLHSSGDPEKNPGDGCWFADLAPDWRYLAVPLRIERNAAACIELVASDFEGDIPVTITLRALDTKKLAQLQIGVAGERRTAKTAWVMSDDRESRTRHDFRVPSGDVTTFVITNMAFKPSETVDQVAAVIFSVGGMETSGASPTTGGGDATKDPDPDPEKAARDRMAKAAPRVTEDGPHTATLKRRAKRDEMTISLGAVPEAAQVQGEVNVSGLSGLGRINPGQHIVWEEVQRRQAEILGATAAVAAGDHVRLTIPRIDHGFTGTFTKAEIRLVRGGNPMAALVNRPADYAALRRDEDQDLHALDLNSCEPNGEVTIDEYTPDFMSGSFSGQLVEKYRRTERGLSASCQPPLTIVRNISGRFWVATPWLLDDRYEGPEPVETLLEDFAADWMKQMGVMIPEMEQMLPDGTSSGPSSSGSSGPGGGSARAVMLEQCDCSCTAYEKVQDLGRRAKGADFSPTPEEQSLMRCTMQCMAQYAACAQ